MARVTTPESFTASHHAAVTHTTAMIEDEAITKEKIKAAAGIEYSKLALTGALKKTDIEAAAGIEYSKLALTGALIDADCAADMALAWSKLSKVESDLADLAAKAHTSLTGVTSDLHHAQAHATDHRAAGTDPIEDALALLAIPTPLTGKVITDITTGLSGDKPAAGNLGKIYAETDTKKVWWDDGAAWQDCKAIPPGPSNLTAAGFQTNPATGTMSNVARINDTATVEAATATAVDQYAEVVLPSCRVLNRFRYFGHAVNAEDGKFKLQYWDAASEIWVDWKTDLLTRKGSWSSYLIGAVVITEKVRLVNTLLDTYGSSYFCEIEFDHD